METKQLTRMRQPSGMMSPEQKEQYERIQKFVKKINSNANEKRVRINKFANNAKFLPIADIETQLDQIYFGLWQTHSFTTKIVANEVCGEIVLEVFHPVAEMWIKRTGAAAVPIQMESQKDAEGKKIKTDITNISLKITNTLVKDYPHLKTECIKNAAKSLGKWFGRDLNRTDAPDYVGLIPTVEAATVQQHNDLKQ